MLFEVAVLVKQLQTCPQNDPQNDHGPPQLDTNNDTKQIRKHEIAAQDAPVERHPRALTVPLICAFTATCASIYKCCTRIDTHPTA